MPDIVTWSQARDHGLLSYFTGIPCKRGHVSERTFSSGICKQCASEQSSEYFHLNREKINEKRRISASCNRDKVRAKKNAYRVKNIDRVLEYERRALAKVIAKDPYRYRIRASRWQKDNPDKVRAREARRRARKNSAGGKFTASDLESLFDRQSCKCAYCFVRLGKKYHADHIVPIAKGGTSWPDNIQLCCQACNLSKGAKDPIVFARYIGRLI